MKIKKVNELNSELQKYINGEINYTPLTNIFLPYGKKIKKNHYNELGKHICDIFDGKLPKELIYFEDAIKEIDKDDVYSVYSSILIFFLTSVITPEILKKLFDEPIYHSEFGEGFYGEYDDETDEYGESDITESYASYFVKIEGVKFHIGYDNRGTNVEVESTENAENTSNAIKKLINMVKDVL